MINDNTISSLTRTEAQLVARLTYEQKDIVTTKDMDNYLPRNFAYRRKLISSLKKKKFLIPIKNGVYIFVPLDAVPTGRRISELLIPAVFFPDGDYYIGYSTMYNYYNMTDQQFQTVYILNPRISRVRAITGVSFKFIKIPAKRMYGLETIEIRGKTVNVSSKERTLIDLIYYSNPVGGPDAAAEILTRFVREGKCDIKKVIEYAVKFPMIITRKRIGLTLEKAGVDDKLLAPLIKSVKKTSLISFTSDRKGKINEKWRVIVSDSSR